MANDKNIVYGYLDESPGLHDANFFFCVDVILTENPADKETLSLMKRVRERLHGKEKRRLPEIKFSRASEAIKLQVLKRMAKLPIKIVALVVDTHGRRVIDSPENYGIIVGTASVEALKFYSGLFLTLDRRFTKPEHQNEMDDFALKVATRLLKRGVLTIASHRDSQNSVLIQLADFAAGALNYKYNHDDDSYWKIIKDLFVAEKVEKWTDLKAATKKE